MSNFYDTARTLTKQLGSRGCKSAILRRRAIAKALEESYRDGVDEGMKRLASLMQQANGKPTDLTSRDTL